MNNLDQLSAVFDSSCDDLGLVLGFMFRKCRVLMKQQWKGQSQKVWNSNPKNSEKKFDPQKNSYTGEKLISLKSRNDVKMRKFDLLCDGKGEEFHIQCCLQSIVIVVCTKLLIGDNKTILIAVRDRSQTMSIVVYCVKDSILTWINYATWKRYDLGNLMIST